MSVNNVSSAAGVNYQPNAMDVVTKEQLYSPGLYASPDTFESSQPKKKKSGFLGFIAKVAIAAAVVGGGAAIARTHWLGEVNIAKGAEGDPSLTGKAKYYIAKLGEWVNTKVAGIAEKFKKKDPAEGEKPPTADGAKN